MNSSVLDFMNRGVASKHIVATGFNPWYIKKIL